MYVIKIAVLGLTLIIFWFLIKASLRRDFHHRRKD